MYTPSEKKIRSNSDIVKAFLEEKEVALTPEECKIFSGYLCELTQKAKAGEAYERELQQEVVRLSLLAQPGVPKQVMEQVAKRMTLEELKAFSEGIPAGKRKASAAQTAAGRGENGKRALGKRGI